MVSWSDDESTADSNPQFLASYGSPIKHGKPRKKCVEFKGISFGRRFIACAVEWVDEEWPNHLQKALRKLWLMYEDSKHDNRIACLEHSVALHNIIEHKNELEKTYEKLVEDVNNLLDSQDNPPQVNHRNDGESSMEKDVEIHKLKAVVDQLKFIHVAQGNYIRKMKHNHLKEKENMSTGNMTLKWCWTDLKKDKEKLDLCIGELMKEKEKWSIKKSAMECCIAHVKKVGENNKRKLKEIKGICDEE
ncbi:hypothetical protein ZWY2020_021962 [Hordeum vulgare]|nr:hypothetical protein ZWY2020_021962 [Hordeum vulgare]